MKPEIARFCDILLDNGFAYEIEGDRVFICVLHGISNGAPIRGDNGFPYVDFRTRRVHATHDDYPDVQRVTRWAKQASSPSD
jgi:hypothetical protein